MAFAADRPRVVAAYTRAPDPDEVPPARVYLQPFAPPVTLGLWGFFGSTMVVSTWLLGWWGDVHSVSYFFAFNAAFGGVAQFLAGVWSFKVRDYIASALLTMWGTYWMAYGFLVALDAAHLYTIPPLDKPFIELAIWFIPLGLFTCWGAVAALSPKAGNLPLFFLLATVGAGCGAVAGGFWVGSPHWIGIGAWLFIFGAGWAWYVASMVLLEYAWRRVILPLGRFRPLAASIPGRKLGGHSVEYVYGQPGPRKGE